MSLKKTVLFTFGFLIILALANAAISSLLQTRTSHSIKVIENDILVTEQKVMSLVQIIEEMRYSTAQVQQWYTDISATRGLDGLNDGIEEAQAYAETFRSDAQKALTLARDLGDETVAEAISQAIEAFDPYQEMGERMALAYIEGGPESGNKIMGNFDAAAAKIGDAVAAMRENVKSLKERADGAMVAALSSLETDSTVTEYVTLGIAGLITLVLGLSGYFATRKIVPRIVHVSEVQSQLAEGNLEAWVPEYQNPPEVAALCKAMYKFKQESRAANRFREEQDQFRIDTARKQKETLEGLADQFQSAVGGVIQALSSSASQLSSTSMEVSDIANRTASRSASVRNAANDAGQDISAVTDSVSEVNKAVEEVASQVTETSRLTNNAAQQAAAAGEKVAALNAASSKINDIVSLISDIAEQTNLLALNATIEAARAGDAGKGFAVVANEVKSLASQTQKATEDISSQVSNMLTEIAASTTAVQQITLAVNQTNSTMTSIAGAVEEQAVTTSEVARAARAASERINSVIGDIGSVSEDATATGGATDELQASADELSRNSDLLTTETENFIRHIRNVDSTA